ncbi:MAG: folate-binding protein [Lysobacteraceae bacterium]
MTEASPATAMTRLDGWQTLQAQGRDAADFLQRQTMNDIAALRAPGDWQWSGLLNAKGRVQALFAVLRRDEETFWLICPDAPTSDLATLLRGVMFRSKLVLSEPAITPAGCWLEAALDTPTPTAQIDAATTRLPLPALSGSRRLLLAADPSALPVDLDAEAQARWRYEDLCAGLPRLSPAQRDAWTPHMLSLDALSAFSLGKGCYPGQEIVARTHYLGRARRRLFRLHASEPINENAAVQDADGRDQGRVVAAASWAGRHVALAVLPEDAAATAGLVVDGIAVDVQSHAAAD